MFCSCSILFIGYAWLLLRYRKAFSRAFRQPTDMPLQHYPSVTVIVPARNEAPFIGQCLQRLLDQQYPVQWEILVVDDHSTDATAAIASSKGVKVISLADHPLPNQIAFKKHAIHTAILQASGEIPLSFLQRQEYFDRLAREKKQLLQLAVEDQHCSFGATAAGTRSSSRSG